MSKTMMEAKEWLRNHTNRTWHVKGDGTVVENDSTVRSSNSEAALRAGTEFQYDVDMGERTAALSVGGVLIHTFRNLPREGVVPYAMFGGSDQVLRLQRAARHKFVMYSRGPGVPLAGLMPTCESVEVVEGFQRARLTPTSSSELAAGVHLLTRLAPMLPSRFASSSADVIAFSSDGLRFSHTGSGSSRQRVSVMADAPVPLPRSMYLKSLASAR